MAIAAVITAIVLGLAPSGASQNLATVLDVDDSYSKTLHAGGEVSYIWLVYNRNESDLVVETDVDPRTGPEWEASVEPNYVILGPGEGLSVKLTVAGATELEEGDVTHTVFFHMTLAAQPTVSETETRMSVTSLESAPPPIAQENKILGLFDNPLPPPFSSRTATFLMSVVIWALLGLVAYAITASVMRGYARRTKTRLDDIILRVIRAPFIVLLLAYGVVQSVGVLEPPRDILDLLFLVYSVVLIIVLTWLGYRIFRGVVIELGKRAAAKKETPLFDVVWPLINRAGAIMIVVLGGAALAALFGFDLVAIVAGMGILGIAIAFAAQESLSNLFSGVFLMLDRPFKEGDLVEINGDRCRIEKIGLRSTTLYHRPSHKILVIPNNKMAREMIINLVEPDLAIRQSTSIGVAYGSDLEKVKDAIVSAARNHPGVITDQAGREPYARLEEFGDSAMIFKMKFWVADADQLNRVRGEVNEAIVKSLTVAGIEIPYPTRELRFHESTKRMSRGPSPRKKGKGGNRGEGPTSSSAR